MLCFSVMKRWAPKYFRCSGRVFQGQGREGPKVEVACHKEKEAPSSAKAHLQLVVGSVRKQKKRKVFPVAGEEHAVSVGALRLRYSPQVSSLIAEGETILRYLQQQQRSTSVFHRRVALNYCFPAGSYHNTEGESAEADHIPSNRDKLCFAAKTEVFAVLKSVLPPAEREGLNSSSRTDCPSTQNVRDASSRRFTVIPDEEVGDVHGYLQRIRDGARDGGNCSSTTTAADGVKNEGTPLSLRDITMFLRLYEAVESEDGPLLLQLMAELRRIVFSGELQKVKCGNWENDAGVVSQLLMVLSSLGLAEERVLQRLISPAGPFLPPRRILHCKEHNLIRLLVALHRFGLHHEQCYAFAVKALRKAAHRRTLDSFVRHTLLKRMKEDLAQPLQRVIHIPRGLNGLTVADVLEALSGMALSLHRERCVVDLLLAVMVATVLNENLAIRSEADNKILHCTEDPARDWILPRALQIQRAVKLSEQMELPHPALPHLFEQLAVLHRGVLVDGGDGDIRPESTGFFDAVTADLVKVARSK